MVSRANPCPSAPKRQWHAKSAQPGDQPGPLKLGRVVEPVAGRRVHECGRQQPEFLAEVVSAGG